MKLLQQRHAECIRTSHFILVLLVAGLAANAQLSPLPRDVTVFTPAQNVSNSPGTSTAHQIAVGPEGNVYVVWWDYSPGYRAVFFSRSVDKGLTFSEPQNLSNDPAGSSWPEIAVDSDGNINIVWTTPFSIGATAFFTRSSDSGDTFSEPIAIANNVTGPPTITFDSSGNIYLSWPDSLSRNIFFSQSNDGGATFSAPVQVSNRPPVGSVGTPQMAVDSLGNIDIVWEDTLSTNWHVWFSRSSDGGSSFSAPIAISYTLEASSNIAMAVDEAGNINAVWNTTPWGNIYLSRSVDGGFTFSRTNVSNTNLTLPFSSPCCAKIATDSIGGIDIIWDDNNGHIFFSRSNDSGVTFASTRFSNAANPEIALDCQGNINLVWNSVSPDSEIRFSRSGDYGATFSAPQTVSGSSGSAYVAMIALDVDGNVDVAWIDNSPGNWDIFFSHAIVLRTPALPAGLR